MAPPPSTINLFTIAAQQQPSILSFLHPIAPQFPRTAVAAVAKPNTRLYDPAELAIAANYSPKFNQQLPTCASLVAFHCAPIIIDSTIDDSLCQTTPAGNSHTDTSSCTVSITRSPMSRAQRGTHLLGLVDSDSEDGLSGPASTRFGSSKPATKTKATSTKTKPKSILKQPTTTTTATVKKEPVTKPTAASAAKRATPKVTATKAATTRQQSALGAGASTMAPAKRKTASTPSVANKRTAAVAAVTASINKVVKASAQKTKPLTARQKAALARAALAESFGNVAATPSTVGKATRASGRGKRAAAAMAPVEEQEEMESTAQTETILEEDTTMHDVTATEEVEEAPKETRTRATRGRPRKAAVVETPVPATATATRGGRGRKKKVEELVVVEEDETTTTQQEEATEEITHEETQIEEEEEEESLPIPGAWRNGPAPASTSRKSSSLGLGFKAHTATGRIDDVELRRKLGEMTQKYEALELKYRDLREVAVKEAERNFDKLRKHSEERTAASDQLIAALKDELSSKKEAARETTRLQKQLEASESQLSTLNAKVAELTSSLTKSKTEINALNIKLTASRQAEAAAAAKIGQLQQVPGSAMKNKQNGNRMLTMGNSEAIAQATQQHQLKEDLYSDLTGLIVRGVKRDQQTGEDVYDCIQTGKNGTLHFKLAHISANTAHIDADETTQIFDEDQFHYMPQLDTNRDRSLIDLLPDYLVEEITFPRQHAAKFYSRVNKALTETVAPQ